MACFVNSGEVLISAKAHLNGFMTIEWHGINYIQCDQIFFVILKVDITPKSGCSESVFIISPTSEQEK